MVRQPGASGRGESGRAESPADRAHVCGVGAARPVAEPVRGDRAAQPLRGEPAGACGAYRRVWGAACGVEQYSCESSLAHIVGFLRFFLIDLDVDLLFVCFLIGLGFGEEQGAAVYC